MIILYSERGGKRVVHFEFKKASKLATFSSEQSPQLRPHHPHLELHSSLGSDTASVRLH